ncbi:IS21 family transposase [Mesorhizobium sp.]|uniref:IS21 family transposase n=1 Tax=Mesorhizobium sp. TaxID=1871066 RepID=UPI00258D4FF2|nr:IS21 family transposase [Mesorhizobium sp.]
MTLWDEYIERHPDGYRYSRFCDLYRGWAANLPVTMRQNHGAGEKLFVDYAGDTVPVVIDRRTSKTRVAHIFVAVLGASSLSFAVARWGEALADWLECHVHALEAVGGAPALLVPDNAKVAVIKACLYDPQVNRSYAEITAHYGSSVLPARPRRPRDKAKVEAAVPQCRAQASGPAAPPCLLQLGRGQRCDRRADGRSERSPGAAPRRPDSAAIVRGGRPPGITCTAGRALCLRRMADLGKSGAGTVERVGFKKLIAEIGLGNVGLVISLDGSRLA